jgi:integrase
VRSRSFEPSSATQHTSILSHFGADKLRAIKVHHLRHTTASLLKKLHVPPRDAQMILGHAHISTTMQIYTHVDEQARNDAITGLDKLLSSGQ